MTEGPARGTKTGTIVVLILLGIGAVGVVSVQLWLRRPGGQQSRNWAAASRQLVEVGGVLQRYYRDHRAFPNELDQLARETDPVTKSKYLPPEMLVNPWGARLAIVYTNDTLAVVRAKGTGEALVLFVEKDQNIRLESH